MREIKKDRPEAGTSRRLSKTTGMQYKDLDIVIVLQTAAKGKRNFSGGEVPLSDWIIPAFYRRRHLHDDPRRLCRDRPD